MATRDGIKTHRALLDEALRSGRSRPAIDAVAGAGDLLREPLPKVATTLLAEGLEHGSHHASWEVRKAVAHALQHLRHPDFQVILTPLLKDESVWVREAAERTRARRLELAHVDTLSRERGEKLSLILSELEARHGKPARDAAMRAIDRSGEEIAAEAAHELIKAISPVDGNLEDLEAILRNRRVLDREDLLRRVALSRDWLRYVRAVVDSVRQVNRQVTLQFRSENLRALVERAIVAVAEDRRQKKIRQRITIDVTISRKLTIDADESRLLQAFRNILQNACEAFDGRKGTHQIRIAATAERPGWVLVTFEDNGCGLSEEQLRGAFKRHTSTKPYGTGIGLPVAKKIVEREHRGTISLAGVEGKGAVVTVLLPRRQEEG